MTIANATPLIALDAVVLDTETTGLDPAKSNLIEIGAIRLRAGRIDETGSYRRLIRPPQPVPAQSTAIHGIDDAALADAPAFSDMRQEIETYLGDTLLIGHSIGFDLAILANEFRRAGSAFTKPRALCTRMLAEVAERNLPGYSLEQVAAWLGIAPQERHSALGDALTTAKVFMALAPKLRDRGIRTLAEAELAVSRLTHVLDDHYRAGWIAPVTTPGDRNEAQLPPRDLYPYRNRVGAVMRDPVIVDGALTLRDALDRMMREKISSLLVSSRDRPETRTPEAIGILTERDVLRAVASDPAALNQPIESQATRPLQIVAADAFAFRAIARMRRLHVRHLGAVDDNRVVCGIVSARDLLRLRADQAIWLGEEIDEAQDATSLARAWAKVPQVATALRREGVSGREVAALISDELCALTGRAAYLVEQHMLAHGEGAPPCAYAVAVLGSAGRGESLLALDQDNALIYADEGEVVERWFESFGKRLADLLNDSGVPYCNGGVMTSNPQWRGSVVAWRTRIDKWIRTSDPAALLSVDIFFDLRGVHGDIQLANALWHEAFDRAKGEVGFAKLLAESAGSVKPAIGLFGNIKTESGRLDLKRTALFGIVTTARILAIRHHVTERATPARLNGILAIQPGDARDLEALRDAQGFLLDLLADQQLYDISQGLPPSNTVAVKRLSAGQQDRLRSALGAVGSLAELTRNLLFRA
jgi:DNA polymerase-3 subunit epsilon/CBS domain-containing protein